MLPQALMLIALHAGSAPRPGVSSPAALAVVQPHRVLTPVTAPPPVRHARPAEPSQATLTPVKHHSSHAVASSGSDSLSDVPGVPHSFSACVAHRESNDGTDQAFNGGVYGIINASGYHVNGKSVADQKAAFKAIYDSTGPSAWAADGCSGP